MPERHARERALALEEHTRHLTQCHLHGGERHGDQRRTVHRAAERPGEFGVGDGMR